jgi:hypothetical protein
MRTNKLSLNVFLSCLEARGFDVKFYYDRIKLYATSANKKAKLDRVCATEDQQKIIPRALIHHDDMSLMIDAHQPDSAYFGRLKNSLTGDYVINYAEFAMDILVRNKKQVPKLRALLNELLVFERKRCDDRFPYGQYQDTHYFGQRINLKDILAIYSDKKSKVAPHSHCVHMEIRLFGSKILKNFGVYTIQDLIDFEHEKIWAKYLDLRDVNYTKLGRLVTGEKVGLTDSSYRRHGKKHFTEYAGSQHLLMKHPQFSTAFAPIKNKRMFKSRLDSALR